VGVGAAVEGRGVDAVGDGPDDADALGDAVVAGVAGVELLGEGLPPVGLVPAEVGGAATEVDAVGVRLACPAEDEEHPAGARASAPVRAPRSSAERRMSEP
jgi:hypothetical protein